MTGINKYIDTVEMVLQDDRTGHQLSIWLDIFDNSLSRKWLAALNQLLVDQYHLEKNYCFFGFVESARNAEYLCEQINASIQAINSAEIGYLINDVFTVDNTIDPDQDIVHDKLNNLHRYFEDLQGVSGAISPYYVKASDTVKWHIRQLNLLCHEYESMVLSMRKAIQAPEWRRPSQLMCWLNAPRFVLEPEDYELFGIDTINRQLGAVYVGVNKAVGKHHYEVFMDEGRWGTGIEELTTTTLKSQTEAAGDFDIEWANNPGEFHWQKTRLAQFRQWLLDNGFDPEDKSLTIGHPQVGQVDLTRSFGTQDYRQIWNQLDTHLNVVKIKTQDAICEYNYNWPDTDYAEQQIKRIQQGN
jgi:hypothetical protein